MARPGDGKIAGRKIAILIAPGIDEENAAEVHEALTKLGAVPRFVAARLGTVGELDPDATLETMPSCLFDAAVIPDGKEGIAAMSQLGHAAEFLKDQYRHCKAILAFGDAHALLEAAGIPAEGDDPALIIAEKDGAAEAIDSFVAALAKHRNWDRAADPPKV
jgi:catalase